MRDDEMNEPGELGPADWGEDLSSPPVPDGPPVDEVIAWGRALRHRRRARAAQGSAAAVITVALVVALAGGLFAGKGPNRPNASLAAFTVSTGPSGTVALTLRRPLQGEVPAALAEALGKAGVPTAANLAVSGACAPKVSPVTPLQAQRMARVVKQVARAQAVTGPTLATNASSAAPAALAPGETVVLNRKAFPPGARVAMTFRKGGGINITIFSVVKPGCGALLPAACVNLGVQPPQPSPVAQGTGEVSGTAVGSVTSTLPAGTLPATTSPAGTSPASTVPATSLPATTLPATTLPATTLPASTLPATTTAGSSASSTVPPNPPTIYCMVHPFPAGTGSGTATGSTGTAGAGTSATTLAPATTGTAMTGTTMTGTATTGAVSTGTGTTGTGTAGTAETGTGAAAATTSTLPSATTTVGSRSSAGPATGPASSSS